MGGVAGAGLDHRSWSEPSQESEATRDRRFRIPWTAVVVVAYWAIGAVAFWPTYRGVSHSLFGNDWDFAQSLWFLGWIPHTLLHGGNPFFSNALLAPSGVNLGQNTASPFLGLLATPLAAAFGPVAAVNLVMVSAMPLSATAAYVALRRVRIVLPAAALAGLVYGFSPYMVGQSLDHVELAFTPLPPLIALVGYRIARDDGPPRRLGLYLGLLVGAQFLISPEILAVCGVSAVVVLGVVLFRRRPVRTRAPRATAEAGLTGVVVAGAIMAYPLWMILAGPQRFVGRPWPSENPYHSDLLSFVVPGPLQGVSFGMGSIGSRLDVFSGLTEAGGYVGIPVLLACGLVVWRSRRTLRMQAVAVVALCGAVLSLGPRLAVDGHGTSIPLPFAAFEHLPLVGDVLPSRLEFALAGSVAAILAFGLDDALRACRTTSAQDGRTGRRASLLAVVVVLVAVITYLPQRPRAHQFQTQAVSTMPAPITHAIPAGDPTAVTYPFATRFTMQPMLWQVQCGYCFKLIGGYAYHPGLSTGPTLKPSLMDPHLMQQFLSQQDPISLFDFAAPPGPIVPITPRLISSTRDTLKNYGVHVVIVDRSVGNAAMVSRLFEATLGRPNLSDRSFSLWVL